MISFSVAKYSLSTYIKEELKNTYRRVIATIEGPICKAICSNIKGHLHPYAVAFNGLVLYIINFKYAINVLEICAYFSTHFRFHDMKRLVLSIRRINNLVIN